jgi:hypothetical protein
MAQRFRFQGVTAQGFVIDEEITAFYVDNPKGSFGLMAGHAPIVSSLETSSVRYEIDGKETKLEVEEGFIEMRDNILTLLAKSIKIVE